MRENVKKSSIRTRIARAMTVLSVVSVIILGIAAVSGLLRMQSQTLRITADMGTQAAENSRTLLENEALDQLSAQAASTAETVEAKLQSIMSQVDILAAVAEDLYASPDSFGRIGIDPPSADDQGVYTAQIVYAERTSPALVADEVGLIGNLTLQMNGVSEFLDGAGTTQIGTESGFIIMCDENAGLKTSMGHLDPVERSWYRKAANSGKLAWSQVFEDSFGRGFAVACGKPVYGPDGTLRAVVSIGSTLDDIGTSATELTIGETGYALVVDQSGQVIMSRNLTVDDEGHVVGAHNLMNEGNESVRDVVRGIASGRSGVSMVEMDGKSLYLAYEPMESIPWGVITVIDVDEVLRPAQEGQARIAALSDQAGSEISGIIITTLLIFAAVMAATMAGAAAFGRTLAGRITSPISHLTEEVEGISGGDLDKRIEVKTGDEIETLADAFNQMTASLKTYIHDLTAVTAEKERIGAELNVATQIQHDMLPCIFPAFPERHEFDIYATMDPAKEVGGDFYDFFMVDDTHLAVVMADVSGKGVPAALFMVIAKTIIKNQALTGEPLAQVFDRANDQLCENNGEGLFVTAFMGLLDINSGDFTFVNAGHNAPLLRRRGREYEYLKMDPGFVLAGLEGMRYESDRLRLEPGDTLFLYTDGVTEALDPNEELFGEDRLKAALNRDEAKELKMNELLPYIRAALRNFADGAEQADDITMLGITYRGASADGNTLVVPASSDELDRVQALVDDRLDRLDCPMETRVQIQIAVEELFVNIARYAYAPEQGETVVRCVAEREPKAVTIEFRDHGKPFDPLAKADADVTLAADERPIGGLGIYMVKTSMDDVRYVYENGENVLTIYKKI